MKNQRFFVLLLLFGSLTLVHCGADPGLDGERPDTRSEPLTLTEQDKNEKQAKEPTKDGGTSDSRAESTKESAEEKTVDTGGSGICRRAQTREGSRRWGQQI